MALRIALGIEYDGSAYSGWQRQDHAPSVQADLEAALARIADAPVTVTCAGRTDAGVHATHQVVHLDPPVPRPERAWVRGVTSNLPAAIGVRWMRPVAQDFHARFSARARRYRYVIRTDPLRPVLLRDRVSWTWRALSIEPMRLAAAHLVGEHDFTSFRAVACQAKHPVRRIHELTVSGGDGFVYVDIEANAFLHHMVRNIAGVLMAVGSGDRPPDWAAEVLAARNRRCGGMTAPAGGLYLVGVRYPQVYALPPLGALPAFA
ncbi:tRNA pseudouridine(38-40) synthase TruA [Arhodomonas aquaeolei]|uniref:tRNA pseudouridine(38-40) synthase TruA n=1 Tax=Arhodomonas aquaeolei TaxID=2369 RepID=UPI00216782D2|nr:tRNA pseudouridine(38-40) synthase TruA [Arhodomonas aquaeolei]MCS4504418.1 tRNA pseudouridine(38-40) synthase TruA [Arhodomonas aquaeolei]